MVASHQRGPPAGDPEYVPFQEQLKSGVDGTAGDRRVDVVGSYNLFGAQREESAIR
jgi:hypothetical protein